MKTEKDIREDIAYLTSEAIKNKKKKPNFSTQLELIKVVQTQTEEKVIYERQKLRDELQKLNDLFPSYLENFTAFKKKYEEDQRRAVKKEFDRVFKIAELRKRIKNLDYLLDHQ